MNRPGVLRQAAGRRTVFTLVCALLLTSAGCSQQHPASIAENVQVPDFTLKNLQGQDVSLSQFKGQRPVLVMFWATWCQYCMEEMPQVIKLHHKLGDRLEILAVNVQESAIKVAPLVKAKGMDFTVLLDEEGEVSGAFGVVGIPTLVLVDKEGMGVAAENGLSPRMLQAIEKTVNTPAVAVKPAS